MNCVKVLIKVEAVIKKRYPIIERINGTGQIKNAWRKLMELLDLREKRDHFEKELLMKYNGTLLTLRANFPGKDKRHEKADFAVRVLYEEVRKHFQPVHEERIKNSEGLILFLLLKENSIDVKRRIIEIEEYHPLGRLLDMDVRDETKIWSRRDFDLPGRKCYLCDDLAVHCVRAEKHRKEDVMNHFIKTVDEFVKKRTT